MSLDPTSKTTLDLITGALRKTGQYAAGEAIDPADANDALDVLNGLLDVLSNEGLAVYNNNENIVTLTPGKQIYTVGIGGDINLQRPLRISNAYSRLTNSNGGIDLPCEIKDTADYTSVGMKMQPGPWPKWLYFNTGFPLAQIFLWPVPTQAIEFHFWTDMLFQPNSLTSALNLPQGYYLMLQMKLAEVLCVEYGIPCPPDVRRLGASYMRAIKTNNASPTMTMDIDAAIRGGGGNDAGFILNGGF